MKSRKYIQFENVHQPKIIKTFDIFFTYGAKIKNLADPKFYIYPKNISTKVQDYISKTVGEDFKVGFRGIAIKLHYLILYI